MSELNLRNLKETKWLITGGTSGLGLALAEQLVERGAHVAVVARGRERLANVSRRLGVIPVEGDVSEKRSIHAISGAALAQLGGLDVLVNGASTLGPAPLKPLLDTECEDFENALQTNLLGPFRLAKACLPSLLLKGQGLVVNISSDASLNAYTNWGAYGASKAALDHLTRIWSEELKGSGVRLLSVDPGDMDTPLHKAALPESDPSSLKSPALAARQLLELLANRRFEGGERIAL